MERWHGNKRSNLKRIKKGGGGGGLPSIIRAQLLSTLSGRINLRLQMYKRNIRGEGSNKVIRRNTKEPKSQSTSTSEGSSKVSTTPSISSILE